MSCQSNVTLGLVWPGLRLFVPRVSGNVRFRDVARDLNASALGRAPHARDGTWRLPDVHRRFGASCLARRSRLSSTPVLPGLRAAHSAAQRLSDRYMRVLITAKRTRRPPLDIHIASKQGVSP